jgi:hypothetical protein
MPVDLGANDIIEVVIEGRLDGQQTISTFHYRIASLDGAHPMMSELENLIGKLRAPNKLWEKYQNVTSDQLNHLNMYAQVIYPIRYRYTNAAEADQTGGVDSSAFPANVQASITRASERAGRAYVSHLAVPGVPIGALEVSQVTVDYKEALNELAEVMLQSVVLTSGTQLNPIIFHKELSPNYSDLVVAFAQDTSRVSRRRTVGLGK